MSGPKDALREAARDRRAAAHGQVDPTPALKRLSDLIAKTTGPVSFYWPIRTEIDPRPVLQKIGETRDVCLPVTSGLTPLTFRRWQLGMEMDTDGFGVSVPAIDDPVTPNVLVVPMLAFDDHGHRLGYGAGHYDRTLAQLRAHQPVVAIGLAYDAQRVSEPLPAEPTDEPLDAIVTETGIRLPEGAAASRAEG